MIRLALYLLILAMPVQADVLLSEDEIAQTLGFGPWPPEPASDPSNRVSANPAAIALGAALFDAPYLSVDGALTCSGCHDPDTAFTTAQPRSVGRERLDRNSPSLRNLAGLRWYGWGGRSDNLWAASLHPILDTRELAHSAETLKTALSNSAQAQAFEQVFGPLPAQSPETVLVNTAKALAAYQETLVTGPTPFDQFRDALEAGDMATAAAYPKAAQRGLQTFLGRGKCSFCHSGPRFTNNEFHDAGVPYFLSDTSVDQGRFGGLQHLLNSPYTLDGDWTDDPEKTGAWAVRNVRQTHGDFGIFRTPSLRGVAETAPYMHNGSLPDLNAVVRHYNEIDLERLHADGEAILQPLQLSETDIADLVAFLESLITVRD